MSYCRWSTDDFACDIYAYESVTGCWVIHVANNRVVGDVPKTVWPRTIDPDSMSAFLASYRERDAFLETASHEPIGLPHDGETFECGDLDEFEDKLRELREIGYRFPDHVFEKIESERLEEAA